MTVQEKLNVIKTSLSDIKISIINKCVTPVGNINTYSEAIDNISRGTPINNQELTVTENGTYTIGEDGLKCAGYLNYDITKVDLSNIKVIKNGGMYSIIVHFQGARI